MITEQDLRQAIAECQGIRNPTANTCMKLAAYYTILREMNYTEQKSDEYSYDSAENSLVVYSSETKFSKAVSGKSAEQAWSIIDELMLTLKSMQPRLYDSVINRLQDI